MAGRLPPAFARRSWWWVFALLIAAPALALALLGVGAIRADDRERQRLDQERRAQVASQVHRLADAALATVLDQLTAVATASAGDPGGGPAQPIAFELDDDGVVSFPNLRLKALPADAPPAAVVERLSSDTRAVVERAFAAEVRGDATAASALYDALRTHADIGAWADWRRRLQTASSPAALIAFLETSAPWAADALTPSGLPLAIAAVTELAAESGVAPAQVQPLARLAIETLDGGRWWMTLDQQRAYRRALNGLFPGEAPDSGSGLTRLDDLAAIANAVRAASRQDGAGFSRAAVARDDTALRLVIWSRSGPANGGRAGVVVPETTARAAVDAALAPLFDAESLHAVVRDAAGTFWEGGATTAVTDDAEPRPLSSLPGWTLALVDTTPPTTSGHDVLTYARVFFPILVLGLGIAMTAWIVRRELALARMQSSFVAAVTHEFKSPITSIRLLMERLASGRMRAGESVERYHAAIGLEADRLENLVNRLLEAQKLQTGERQYDFRPAALDALVAQGIERLRPQAEAKHIDVRLDAPVALPRVAIDVDAMSDAVLNLVDNAIKYSPEHTTVIVSLVADDEAVRLTVSDQGIGVDPAEAERLFEPFYRSQRGDRANVHGTGLGLALVRATAEAHGGRVTAEPNPGRGSRFTLSLPIEAEWKTEATPAGGP